MNYIKKYSSPLGVIILISDGENLTNLSFENSPIKNNSYKNIKYKESITYSKPYNNSIKNNFFEFKEKDLEIFKTTEKWLDIYFSGKNPDFTPKYKIENASLFKQEVIDEILKIPYGKTSTYNDIAKSIAKKHNIKTMSAQAVGGAVGSNPIGIIIPCHRVIGTNGSLTGYAGGLQNKIQLLKLEGLDITILTLPKNSKFL